jgi:hypothetical protein
MKRFIKVTPTKLLIEKHYDFSGGLDTYSANEVIEPKYSPYLRNCRNTSRNTIKTRNGAGFYSVPLGETQDISQTSVTGASTQSFGLVNYAATGFSPGVSGRLTKIDLNLKTTSPAGTGPVIVEIRNASGGDPGSTILATSSISSASVTGTAAYLSARFIEAPQLTAFASYWIIVYVQDNGTNTYLWTSTTNLPGARLSTDSGLTWTGQTFQLNFKSYISTDSPVLGLTRFYRSTPSATTILWHGTNGYTINDGTGATTSFKSGLSASATDYYTAFAQDVMYYVNGFDAPRQYDLTTDSAVAGSPGISKFVALHKNRLFFVSASDPTKIIFSDEGAYTTYQSTSFLYVPAPKSTDPITAIVSFQDNLYIFTRKKKWVLFGNTLANFILREAAGKQGATSQNSVVVYGNYIFFCNDVGAYQFNGTADKQLSIRIVDDYQAIADKTKIHGRVWKDAYYIFNPAAGSGVNNQALIYDLLFNSWFYDTNQYITRSVILDGPGDTTNQLLLGSSVVGAVYYAETQTSDLGKAIAFEFRTKYNSFGDPSRAKRVKRFYPQFKTASTGFNLTLTYDKDFNNAPQAVATTVSTGATIPLYGTAVYGTDVYGAAGLIKPREQISGKFFYLQYRFSRTGVDNSIELLGYESYFIPSRAR